MKKTVTELYNPLSMLGCKPYPDQPAWKSLLRDPYENRTMGGLGAVRCVDRLSCACARYCIELSLTSAL